MDEKELAYLAGFFDADGTLGVYMRTKQSTDGAYFLRVVVGGVNEASIRRYLTLGGRLYGPYTTRAGSFRKRPWWQWMAYGQEGKAALVAMLPYLAVKREQAIEALKMPVRTSQKSSDADKALRTQIAGRIVELKRVG